MKTGKRILFRGVRLHADLKLWANEHGQDLIEYALMAGFVAVAAGAIMPGIATNISIIFSKIASTTSRSASQGS